MSDALVLPVPLDVANTTEASGLSQRVLTVVDEVVATRGYLKEDRPYYPYGEEHDGVTGLAVYYKTNASTLGGTVYISVVIGGLTGVDGTIRPRNIRTVASVGFYGKSAYEVRTMAHVVLRALQARIKDVQFKLEVKSEFGSL